MGVKSAPDEKLLLPFWTRVGAGSVCVSRPSHTPAQALSGLGLSIAHSSVLFTHRAARTRCDIAITRSQERVLSHPLNPLHSLSSRTVPKWACSQPSALFRISVVFICSEQESLMDQNELFQGTSFTVMLKNALSLSGDQLHRSAFAGRRKVPGLKRLRGSWDKKRVQRPQFEREENIEV